MVDGEEWTWTGELEVGGRMDPKIYLRNLPGNPGRNQETARVSVVEKWTVSKRGHGGPRWGEGGGLEVEEGDGEVLESTWELQTGIGTSRE